MLDILLNLLKKHEADRLAWLRRDWFGDTFRQRVPLLLFLIGFQMLYFPINQFLSAKGGGANVAIPAIDGNIPLLPVFAVPYALGFAVMPIFPVFAALRFPRRIFQEYMIAFFAIMVCGYSIWILFPAYVLGDDALDAAADTLEDAQVRGYVAADDAVDNAKDSMKKAAKTAKTRAANAASKAKDKAGEMASKAKNKAKEKASDLTEDMRSKAVATFEKVHTTIEDMSPDELNTLLLHEVRKAVEGVTQNPNTIKIVVEDDGRVILRGPVMPEEMDRLIEAVDAVPGVTVVQNDLDPQGMVGDDRSMYNP